MKLGENVIQMKPTPIKNLYVVEPDSSPLFPNGVSLIYLGSEKAIIDMCAGYDALERALKMSKLKFDDIDYILLTHLHPDHTKFVWYLKENYDVKICMNELESSYVASWDKFFEFYGLINYPDIIDEWIKEIGTPLNFKPFKVDVKLKPNTFINIGDLEIDVISSPGHTKGHTFFKIDDLLIVGDIDLTNFPWYGHPTSSLIDFVNSVNLISELNPKYLVSMHRGLLTNSIEIEVRKYLDIIESRNRKILERLKQPKTIDELVDYNIIYPRHNLKLLRFFEKNMLEHHINYLLNIGKIKKIELGDRVLYQTVS